MISLSVGWKCLIWLVSHQAVDILEANNDEKDKKIFYYFKNINTDAYIVRNVNNTEVEFQKCRHR